MFALALSGQIEDVIATQQVQRTLIGKLAKELSDLRLEQENWITGYATQEDLKHLAEKFQQVVGKVDRKRQHDNDLIVEELKHLGNSLTHTPLNKSTTPPPTAPTDHGAAAAKSTASSRGYVMLGVGVFLVAWLYEISLASA